MHKLALDWQDLAWVCQKGGDFVLRIISALECASLAVCQIEDWQWCEAWEVTLYSVHGCFNELESYGGNIMNYKSKFEQSVNKCWNLYRLTEPVTWWHSSLHFHSPHQTAHQDNTILDCLFAQSMTRWLFYGVSRKSEASWDFKWLWQICQKGKGRYTPNMYSR